MADQEKRQPIAISKKSDRAVTVIPWTDGEKIKLAGAIGQVFDLQKQFGKTPGQLKNIIDGFCWALQRYPVEMVIAGLGEYIRRKPDIPTPSDIVAIIDPTSIPFQPDKAYYVRLQTLRKEQGKNALNDDEENYIRQYEEHIKRSLQE